MDKAKKAPTFGTLLFYAVMIGMGLIFVFAAVQGEYGLFERIQIEAEADKLGDELRALEAEVAAMENKTRRLSDDYLDLDLLDEQAREVLGFIGAGEVIVN